MDMMIFGTTLDLCTLKLLFSGNQNSHNFKHTAYDFRFTIRFGLFSWLRFVVFFLQFLWKTIHRLYRNLVTIIKHSQHISRRFAKWETRSCRWEASMQATWRWWGHDSCNRIFYCGKPVSDMWWWSSSRRASEFQRSRVRSWNQTRWSVSRTVCCWIWWSHWSLFYS